MFTIPETNLVVHPLCLGGNVFGWSADEDQSQQVLDAYSSFGGNFIDTADVYSEWKDGNVGGESETIIGNWMKARGNRSSLVIATKVSKLSSRPGLSAANIIAACDDSLQRLQSDYIDLYYSHDDDASVPIAETLGAYATLIAAGKVRYIAASQHTAPRLQQALDIALENNLPSYIALQDHYNLMERTNFEGGQADVLAKNDLSMIPFFSLARGFLSGKYRPGVVVDSIRADGVKEYENETGWATIAALAEIADAHNSTVSAIALGWLRAHPQVSTPLASARTVEQLKEIIEIVELTADEVAHLNSITA